MNERSEIENQNLKIHKIVQKSEILSFSWFNKNVAKSSKFWFRKTKKEGLGQKRGVGVQPFLKGSKHRKKGFEAKKKGG